MARYEIDKFYNGGIFDKKYIIYLVSDNNRRMAYFNRSVRTAFGAHLSINKFKKIMSRLERYNEVSEILESINKSDLRTGMFALLKDKYSIAYILDQSKDSDEGYVFYIRPKQKSVYTIESNRYKSVSSCIRGIKTLIEASKTDIILLIK